MSNYEAKTAVSHSDLTHLDEPTFNDDEAKARINLDKQHPEYPLNGVLASAVAIIMDAERSRRLGNYYNYRSRTGDGTFHGRMFQDGEDPIEASLIDLDERVRRMNPDQIAFARSMGGKGISADLGHVDQLGSWEVGGELDDRIRDLPNSEVLEAHGFRFTDTYGSSDSAKKTYRIHLNGHSHDGASSDSPGAVIKGVRRRAAADVITDNGDTYEIVKHSTFLIHSAQLGADYLEKLKQIIDLSSEKATAPNAISLMNELGNDVIEPFVKHNELREVSPAIIAVSSLYFALHRAK